MNIYEIDRMDELKRLFSSSAVTLGNYDGIHRGHSVLIRHLKEAASLKALPSVLITYSPNPAAVLGKNPNHRAIYSERKKEEILQEFGIENLIRIRFTREFSEIHAPDFVRMILKETVHASHIVIGFNHFFGKNREGDYQFLKKISEKSGFVTEEIPPVFYNEEQISSSKIRQCISEGNIKKANCFLGRDFSISGRVVSGDQKGREIGFPTANLSLPEGIIVPGNGVYSGYIKIQNSMLPAMTNIGTRPTLNGTELRIESHIIGFQGDLYGTDLEVYLAEKIREEKKFPSFNDLKLQLEEDRKKTEYLISNRSEFKTGT